MSETEWTTFLSSCHAPHTGGLPECSGPFPLPCPALPNGLTYLSRVPSHPGSLSVPGGGAGGPGARSLVQQPRDEGCVWGAAPFVPLSHAHTCLCVKIVKPQVYSLWSEMQCGRNGEPRLALPWTPGSRTRLACVQARLQGFNP